MQLDILRFIITLFCLGYASISDIKKREVTDKVWLLSVPLCLALTLIDVYAGTLALIDVIASLVLALVLGFSLFYLCFYGGADLKALMLIAVTVPAYLYDGLFLRIIFPLPLLLVFFLAILLSALIPLTVLSLNFVDLCRGKDPLRGITERNRFRQLLLLMTTRRMSFEDLKKEGLKYLPAEKVICVDGKYERKPVYSIRVDDDAEKLVDELEQSKDIYVDGILASPTIPMIVFLTLGLTLLLPILYT